MRSRRRVRTSATIERWRKRRLIRHAKEVSHLRGKFLEECWLLERKVAALIAFSLSPEKTRYDAFLVAIMGRLELSFSIKCQILADIHELLPIAGMDNGAFKRLKTLREFRNKLAHGTMVPDSLMKEVEITRVDKGKIVNEKITLVELRKHLGDAVLMNKALQVTLELNQLFSGSK
jgi:hypothetical protein